MLVGILGFGDPARATDGRELVEACQEETWTTQHGYCLGMIQGVWYTATLYEYELEKEGVRESRLRCIPEEATTGQVKAVVLRYIDQHPEHIHRPVHALIVAALIEAFPCGQ